MSQDAGKAAGAAAGTAASIAGTAGAVGAATGASAAAAAGIGAAIGAAVPIPVLNVAIAAVAAAFAALGAALTAGGRENFETNKEQSYAFLLLWEVCPGLAFTKLDNATTPGQVAFLARILAVRAGIAVDPSTGRFPGMHAPGQPELSDEAKAAAVNRYLYGAHGKPGSTEGLGPGDPRIPFTNPAFLAPLRAAWAGYQGDGRDFADRGTPPLIRDAATARAVLAWMRAHPEDIRFAVLSQHTSNSASFLSCFRRVRKIAGEDLTKRDPILDPILGDTTAADPRMAGSSSSPSEPIFTPGRVAALAAGAVALGGLAFILTRRKRTKP